MPDCKPAFVNNTASRFIRPDDAGGLYLRNRYLKIQACMAAPKR